MCKGERVIAVSNTIREYIKRNYPGTDMGKVVVIHRGVDPAEFPRNHQPTADWLAAWQKDFPQFTGKKILTLPGRLSRLKGHEDFLQLLTLLRQRSDAYHGLIVGDIDTRHRVYLQDLYQRINDLGLKQHVTFSGGRSDMRDVYAVSDVVLSLSSKPESFGRTVVEALSIGTPVVGYDQGGVGEILADLFPDGRVSTGNIEELANRVHAVCQQKPPLQENHYLLQDMLVATLSCYDTLLKTAR
jgi:glycosyltransferase involved in cell wall biosynthesis